MKNSETLKFTQFNITVFVIKKGCAQWSTNPIYYKTLQYLTLSAINNLFIENEITES